MAHILIDPCTAAVTSIECFFKAQRISIATGFFWAVGGERFLVTNWHVVTGRHPVTGAHLSKTAGEPDRLILDVYADRHLNRRTTVGLELYDAAGNPLWREHRIWRSGTDVICVPLGDLGNHVFALNEVDEIDVAQRVGDEVFVLGYPRGIGPDRLAIWKRASIASEPDVRVDKLPLVLIDTTTAEGMSGGPVITRVRGGAVLTRSGNTSLGADGFAMLGVYAGRLPGQNETEVTLGRVWKKELIGEIWSSAMQGSRDPRGLEPTFPMISFL